MKEEHVRFEEEFHEHDNKLYRKERKLASAQDRSKFKKSDQDQLKKKGIFINLESCKRGRVLAISPEGILVDHEKQLFLCTLKGLLKKEKQRLKNLIAVGDFVHFEPHSEQEGSIVHIEERYSILSRADNLSRQKQQLIAVNIDQVLIVASVVLPQLKPFLIDRYLIAAKAGNMQPLIVINKIDLLTHPPHLVDTLTLETEKALYREFYEAYLTLNVPLYPVSANTGEGIAALKEAMKGKTSVLSGQSGVGKSSLINALLGTELMTGEIVAKTSKGSHTTTTAHLIPLEEGGFCIDTPGIKSFGLWDLQASEIKTYYPDIQSFAHACKFPDCSHLQEPGCGVKAALEAGHLSPLRFASYCALVASLEEEHKNR